MSERTVEKISRRRFFVTTASFGAAASSASRAAVAPDVPSLPALRFAVFFDTHYCLDRGKPLAAASSETSDIPRYVWMRYNLFPRLLAELQQHAPDLAICTGDIVEGGGGDPSLLRRELQEVFERFAAAKIPVLNARGNHEPGRFYGEIALPIFSALLGKKITENYFAFDRDGARFIFIDYLALASNTAQARWLTGQILTSPNEAPLFVFTHAPLVNFARPFFSHEPMQQVLREVFAKRPPTILFCGHTHNQAFTFHRGRSGAFVQIKGSSVGFPDGPCEPLDDRHVLLLGKEDTYYWGVPEDHCPSYWIVEVRPESIMANWYGVGRGLLGSAHLSPAGAEPIIVKQPDIPINRLRRGDLPLVKEASLEAFMSGDRQGDFEFILNGHSLGYMAPNGNFAARRSLPLTRKAMATLSGDNELKVVSGSAKSWLLGSVRIVARTYDGRFLASAIPRFLFACGDYARRATGDSRFKMVAPAEPVVIHLEIK